RVYQSTDRRIEMSGVASEIQSSLQGSGAIVYAVNAGDGGSKAAAKPAVEETVKSLEEDVKPVMEEHSKPAVPAPAVAQAVPPKVLSFPAALAPKTEAHAVEAPVGPEMASLQSKLKRKIVEFRNLFEITQALNLAQDLDEVMNLFGLSVMGQFGLERLALFLVDPDKDGHLVHRHVRGFPQAHFQ